MGLEGVTPSPPPPPPKPKGKPEATAQGGGGGNGGGVISKLEDGFFEEKGVSNIALRIAHDILSGSENRLEAPEGASETYLKLLFKYQGPDPEPELESELESEPVAQVDTLTVGGTVEENDVFTITLDPEGESESVEFMALAETTIDDVVAELVDAWNETFGGDITAEAGDTDSGILTLTANTPGVPFSVIVETTNADNDENVPSFDSETTTENVGVPEVAIEEDPEPDPDIVPPEPDPDIVPPDPDPDIVPPDPLNMLV